MAGKKAKKKTLKVKSLEEIQKTYHDNSIIIREREYPITGIADGDLENLPTIVPELAGIKPPDPRAFSVLEKRILRDGVVEPLVAANINGQLILLDGHMRLEIIIKHNIKQFKIVVVELPSIQAAMWWIVEQTYSYRHLNMYQRVDLALEAMPFYKELVPFPINKFNFLIRLRRSYFNRFLRFGTTKPCLRSE